MLVQVVIGAGDADDYDAAAGRIGSATQLRPPVSGGPTRQASVRNGLEALEALSRRTGC